MRQGAWLILLADMLWVGGCHWHPEARSGSPAVPALSKPVETGGAGAIPSDAALWSLSRDPAAIAAGRIAFTNVSCRTCHGAALTGGAAPNLMYQLWLHGGTPSLVLQTIRRGVPSRGMPTWGNVLEPSMVQNLVAFIFSFHREGEPIEQQASFTPFTPVYE